LCLIEYVKKIINPKVLGVYLMETVFDKLKFGENGLITAVAQDVTSEKVLMVAYMNEEALKKTFETGLVHYYSRSRRKLWLKGETSGHYQHLKSVYVDCDEDALLLKVEQDGVACHTGHYSCFYREIDRNGIRKELTEAGHDRPEDDKSEILKKVYEIVCDRKQNPKKGSYTNYLFEKGLDKILKKVGEEAGEVIIAAKNLSKDEIRYEVSDLVYHVLVLLAESNMSPEDIYDELTKRHK
jgi:phosphoribosyl-AMP cyclohydrolase / phosphoribosyl-ATP pyrophosphohydrolase